MKPEAEKTAASKALKIIGYVVPIALGLFFLKVGIMHFTDPEWFEPIVPKIAGSARFWVLISGAAEIILGIGLIIPRLRKWGGYGTAVFLILVYPANLNMWINDLKLGDGTSLSSTGHIIRLLIQVVAIAACIWIARKKDAMEELHR